MPHDFHDFSRQEIPFSQMTHAPSRAALSGDVGRGLGALPARRQAPVQRSVPPSSVLYVWPEPSRHHPLPRLGLSDH
jgi:hypothetical protein